MDKMHQSVNVPVMRTEQRWRPSSFASDVILPTLSFLILARAVWYCWEHQLAMPGAIVAGAIPFMLWRLIVRDGARLESEYTRGYAPPTPPQRKIKPVMIETTPGGYTVRYGQLSATQDEYQAFLDAILAHPQQRLTIRAIPRSMLPDRDKRYGGFCQELRRLSWVNNGNIFTDAGIEALETLAAGDSPTD